MNFIKMRAKKYCIVFGCLNSDKDPDLSFFSLPKDIERRRKWLKLIDREDLLQKDVLKKSSHVVCSEHFDDSSIKIIKHLKDDALPKYFLYRKTEEGSSCSKTRSTSKTKGKAAVSPNKTKKGKTQSSFKKIKGKSATTPTEIEIEVPSYPSSAEQDVTRTAILSPDEIKKERSFSTEAQSSSIQIEIILSPDQIKKEVPSCSEAQISDEQVSDKATGTNLINKLISPEEIKKEVPSLDAQSSSAQICRLIKLQSMEDQTRTPNSHTKGTAKGKLIKRRLAND